MNELLSAFTKSFYTLDSNKTLLLYLKIKSKYKKIPEVSGAFSDCKEFLMYKEEAKVIKTLLNIAFLDCWHTVREEDDIKIDTAWSSQKFYMRLKLEINANPLEVLSIFNEAENMSEWVETLKTSSVIEDYCSHKKLIHFTYNLPWPLNNRESVLRVNFMPMSGYNTIFLTAYTPEEYHYGKSYGNFINMVLPACGIWIKCLNPKSEVTILIEANKYIVSAT